MYTVVRKKTEATKNREVVGNERGLIPMKTAEVPPAHWTKIYTERNESKEQLN